MPETSSTGVVDGHIPWELPSQTVICLG